MDSRDGRAGATVEPGKRSCVVSVIAAGLWIRPRTLSSRACPTGSEGGHDKRLSVSYRIEPDGAWQKAKGRDAWALLALRTAGKRGVTPIDTPGPRWSGYVFKLRRMGLVIETVHESHGGPFAGTHARYVLHSPVAIAEAAHGEAA